MHIYKRLDVANIDGLVLSACVQMQSLPSIARVQVSPPAHDSTC